MKYQYNDGGRESAGFRGTADDCACRAVAIITGWDYREVYEELGEWCKREKPSKTRRGKSHPRTGVHSDTLRKYLAHLGFEWVPTMKVGEGCKTHLHKDELPAGRLIVRCSRHYTAVIDGVVHDNHDPRRDGSRCVYGYWKKD
jgi:hypothetical protein